MRIKLDKKEKELLKSFEEGEWVEVPDMDSEIHRHRTYARQNLTKNKRVNIRISQKDLDSIKRRAIEEGIPYQTLLTSLIHKYVNGKLIERDRVIIRK